MRVALFCHSILSDWNHGNAHFLRGVATELILRGHQVRIFEPQDAWSFQNLVREHGEDWLDEFRRMYPHLRTNRYDPDHLDLDEALDGADIVLVHEWNSPSLIRGIAEHRKHSSYRVLFHDTHHRSVSDSQNIFLRALESYDGILAFGDSVSQQYRRLGWGTRVWTWHEAADVRIFHPLPWANALRSDVVWVGNWGDGERTTELKEFLLDPVRELGLRAQVHGVRYPNESLALLKDSGIEYKGWAPNFRIPEIFSRSRATVHIPRRPYRDALPGVPTIRVFEALACGIPLISAPWSDSEHLFRPGEDFLTASTGSEMKRQLRALFSDEALGDAVAAHGLRTILSRHTCGHRVDELLKIYAQLGPQSSQLCCQTQWQEPAIGALPPRSIALDT